MVYGVCAPVDDLDLTGAWAGMVEVCGRLLGVGVLSMYVPAPVRQRLSASASLPVALRGGRIVTVQ